MEKGIGKKVAGLRAKLTKSAVDKIAPPPTGKIIVWDVVRLLLFTGARVGEVLSMRWDNIDFERAVWSKPASATKQKRDHHAPLTEDALALLRARRKVNAGEWVFPARYSPTGHLTSIRVFWNQVCMRAGAVLEHVEPLPGPQRQPAAQHRDGHLDGGQRGADVGGHVVRPLLAVAIERGLLAHHPAEKVVEVGQHVGIGVLLHGQAGRGVLDEGGQQTVGDGTVAHESGHVAGDVGQALAACAHRQNRASLAQVHFSSRKSWTARNRRWRFFSNRTVWVASPNST